MCTRGWKTKTRLPYFSDISENLAFTICYSRFSFDLTWPPNRSLSYHRLCISTLNGSFQKQSSLLSKTSGHFANYHIYYNIHPVPHLILTRHTLVSFYIQIYLRTKSHEMQSLEGYRFCWTKFASTLKHSKQTKMSNYLKRGTPRALLTPSPPSKKQRFRSKFVSSFPFLPVLRTFSTTTCSHFTS